ncbi:MAG: hypothetical protein L0Z49_08910 [Actinobacteria bacterium]|nr:hypothetical protein [Actinomycetota bacterium]
MAVFYRFALAGDPVEHSMSPVLHRTALRIAGLEGDYVAVRAGPARLGSLVDELRSDELSGLNVTMPLKETATRLADLLTPEAAAAGSVNSLRGAAGVIEGHSTDVTAFRALYARIEPDTILVLGGGGSARAALAAGDGARCVVSLRSPERARGLLARWPALETAPWGTGVPGALVVNATPLGMSGESLPDVVLGEAIALIDLPYGVTATPAVGRAKEAGIVCVDGVEFLALQAAHCFEWFTGVAVDSATLAAAARNV